METNIQEALRQAENTVIWIRHFDHQCACAEETDTGEAWEVLLAAEKSLMDLIDAADPAAAQRLREETSAIVREYQDGEYEEDDD